MSIAKNVLPAVIVVPMGAKITLKGLPQAINQQVGDPAAPLALLPGRMPCGSPCPSCRRILTVPSGAIASAPMPA